MAGQSVDILRSILACLPDNRPMLQGRVGGFRFSGDSSKSNFQKLDIKIKEIIRGRMIFFRNQNQTKIDFDLSKIKIRFNLGFKKTKSKFGFDQIKKKSEKIESIKIMILVTFFIKPYQIIRL